MMVGEGVGRGWGVVVKAMDLASCVFRNLVGRIGQSWTVKNKYFSSKAFVCLAMLALSYRSILLSGTVSMS